MNCKFTCERMTPKVWILKRYQVWIKNAMNVWQFRHLYYLNMSSTGREKFWGKAKLNFKGDCLNNFHIIGECKANSFHNFFQFLLCWHSFMGRKHLVVKIVAICWKKHFIFEGKYISGPSGRFSEKLYGNEKYIYRNLSTKYHISQGGKES